MTKIENYEDFDLGPIDPVKASKILRDGYNRLNTQHEWLSAGTALGLYRDGDFIPGDTDIDIAMTAHEHIDEEVRKSLEGYRLVRDIYIGGRIMQMAFIKDSTILDIYVHWLSQDGTYYNASENGIQLMPERIYKNLKEYPTKYGNYNFPFPPEEYFILRYGNDWQTPQDKKPIYYKLDTSHV